MISDYKPDFFYFELEDFSARPSFFTGALLFAEQGSIKQLFIGIIFVMGFFVLQVVASPFRRAAHNWLKQVELLCLLATFQVCLVIRVNGQQIGNEAYDQFLVYTVLVMLAIFAGSTVLAVWRSSLLRKQIGTIDSAGFLDEESIRQSSAAHEQHWQQRVSSELANAERRASEELDAFSDSSSDKGAAVDIETQKQRNQATAKRNALALEHRRMREARGVSSSADSN